MFKYKNFYLCCLFLALSILSTVSHAQVIESFIDYSYDTCIFKHTDYTLDLSGFYDPTNQTLAFGSNFYFNLCGQTNNKCTQFGPLALACNSNAFGERGVPFLKFSDNGITLNIPYIGMNKEIEVKVGTKLDITSIPTTNVLSVQIPRMVIKKNDPTKKTLDISGPVSIPIFTSTMKINADFIKSLDSPAIDVKIYSYEGVYLYDCNQIVLNQTQGYLSCIYSPTGREYINTLYRLEVTMGTLIGYDLFYFKQTKEISQSLFSSVDWDRCLFTNTDYSFNLSSYYNPAQPVLSVPFHDSNQEFFFNLCGTKNAQCNDDFACFNGYQFKSRNAILSIDDEGPKLLITYSNSFYPSDVQVEVKFNTKNDIYINNYNNNRIIVQSPSIAVIKSIYFGFADRQFRVPGGLFKLENLNDHLQSSPLPSIHIQISDNNGPRDCPVVEVNSGLGYITCQSNTLGTEIFSLYPTNYINLTIDTQAKGYKSIGSAYYGYGPTSDTEYIPMIESDFDRCIFRHYNYTFDLSQGAYDPSNPITTVETKTFVLCGNTIAYCGFQYCPFINFYGWTERNAYLIQNEGRYKLLIEFYAVYPYLVELDNLDSNNFDYQSRVYMYLPKMVRKQNHLLFSLKNDEILRSSTDVTIIGDFIKQIPNDSTIPIDISIQGNGVDGNYFTNPCQDNTMVIDRIQGTINCQIIPSGYEVVGKYYRVQVTMGESSGFNEIKYREPIVYSTQVMINSDYVRCIFTHKAYTIDLSDLVKDSIFNVGRTYLAICGGAFQKCSEFPDLAKYGCDFSDNSRSYFFNRRVATLKKDEEGIKLVIKYQSFQNGNEALLEIGIGTEKRVKFLQNYVFRTPQMKIKNTNLVTLQTPSLPRYAVSTLRFSSDYIKYLPANNLPPVSVKIYNSVDNTDYRECPQPIIDQSQGFISCQCTPTGKESAFTNYTVMASINTVDFYSSESLFFYAPQEISRQPMIKSNFERCIFKSNNYIFDLTQLYNPNDPVYIVDNYKFILCGDVNNKCEGDGLACNLPVRYSRREASVLVDQQAVKLLMVYYSYDYIPNPQFSVEVFPGAVGWYSNERLIIQSPLVAVRNIISFTTDYSISRASQSTMTINGDFVKGLTSDTPIKIFVRTFDDKYYSDCTQTQINSNQAVVTCQINPTGNELLDSPYQLVVDVNNTDSGSSYFYFHPKSCPSSCGKGTCDTQKGVCLCEQGYTSYDCSLKLSLKPLSNPSIIPSPIDQLNAGYQSPTSSDLVFTIDLVSLAISNSFGYILNSTPIRSISNVQSVYGTNSATFSSQSFKYDLVFSPSIAPNGTSNSVLVCDNRVNIPLYNQAAAIASVSMYSASPSENVEAIYEISNNKMNSMNASININKDSIIITDSTTDSYLLFSVSPLFKLNNKVSPYIARARILTTEDALQLQGYKSTSIYVSILVPSTKQKDVIELITTINSFTAEITISASSLSSTPLFTIIISISSLLLFFV